MALPPAVETLWNGLQAIRGEVLGEVEGLSQEQSEWRPGDKDWSIGEIIHHLTLGEVATSKLTIKLIREAEAAGTLRPYPPDLTSFARAAFPPGPPPEATPLIWPEQGRRFVELLAEMKSTRERSRQSIERLASVDPRPLRWKHEATGIVMDLSQYWAMMVLHDRMHIQQIRAVKASPGFPER